MAWSMLPSSWSSFGIHGLLSAVIVTITYQLLSMLYNIWWHPLRDYPGPLFSRASSLPRMWKLSQGRDVERVAQLHEKYGHVVRMAPNELSFIDPQAMTDIYGNGSTIAGRKWPGMYDPYVSHVGSLNYIRDEQHHTKVRRSFGPAFTTKALAEQEPMIKGLAELLMSNLTRQISAEAESNESKKPATIHVDLVRIWNFCTFDVMGELAFGGSFQLVEKMKEVAWISAPFDNVKYGALLVSRTYYPILKPIIGFVLWLIKEQASESLRIVSGLIDERFKAKDTTLKDRHDIWSEVLRLRELDSSKHYKLTQDDIYRNGVLFLLAGTETSATTLSGLSFLLLKNPEKFQQLTKEIRSSFTSTKDITFASLASLTYLNDCIEEALRMYSPVATGVARDVPDEGAMISGKWVPPGTVVIVSQHVAFTSSRNFRDPDQFLPERWSRSQYDSDSKSVMQPFIIGTRGCIGKPLAYHEIRLFLTYMIYHFDMKLVDEEKDWLAQENYILWIKTPLMVKLSLR